MQLYIIKKGETKLLEWTARVSGMASRRLEHIQVYIDATTRAGHGYLALRLCPLASG